MLLPPPYMLTMLHTIMVSKFLNGLSLLFVCTQLNRVYNTQSLTANRFSDVLSRVTLFTPGNLILRNSDLYLIGRFQRIRTSGSLYLDTT
jgi:hypothetical protein